MCLNDPSGDPRPRRLIDLCNDLGYSVYLMSYSPNKEAIKYEQLFLIPKKEGPWFKNINRYIFLAYSVIIQKITKNNAYLDYLNNKRFYLNKLDDKLQNHNFDLILIEDIQFLPIAYHIKKDTPIVFDVREYYPKQRENNFLFRNIERPERIRLCENYLKKCDLLFTVSEGLAIEYKREFGVDMTVIKSVPNFQNIPVRAKDDGLIRLVHHGVANESRKLENMIAVLKQLDERFTLDFFLTGDINYINKLKEISANDPRITFNEPVPFSALIKTLTQFDIGFFYVEPTTFNLKHCLPNKFFEYVQARLMLAVGPSPDMASLVQKYNCGIISDEFTVNSMASRLASLNYEQISNAKLNSDKAASELCFEVESQKIISLIHELIK